MLRRRRCGGGLSRLLSCTPSLDQSRALRSLELLPPIVEGRRGHGILDTRAVPRLPRECAVDVLHCSAAATDLGGQLSERARVLCAPRPYAPPSTGYRRDSGFARDPRRVSSHWNSGLLHATCTFIAILGAPLCPR